MKPLVFLIFFMSMISSYAQEDFTKGLIVTKYDDTIYCMVPATSYFGKVIRIMDLNTTQIQRFKLSNIKYLANSNSVYENVSFYEEGKKKETQKLMWLKIEGSINLYLEKIPILGASHRENDFLYTPITGYLNTYVVRKTGRSYLVNKYNFIKVLSPLITDNEKLLNNVTNNIYRYEHIEYLIKQYNSIPESGAKPVNTYNPVPSVLLTNIDYKMLVKNKCDDKVFTKVGVLPSIQGGEKALSDSLFAYFQNKKIFISGKAIFVFLVSKQSELIGIEKLEGEISNEQEFKEGLLTYSHMWKPALQNEVKVCAVVQLDAEIENGRLKLNILNNAIQ